MLVMAIIWTVFIVAAIIVTIRPAPKKVEWKSPSVEALTQHGENLLDERKAEIMAFRRRHEKFLENHK